MESKALAKIPAGTSTATLIGLLQKGVRYSTVIDVGCADGNYYVQHHQLGLFPDSVPLNIDPNPIYENSLKAIKEVLGGHYAIAAASDREGEVELTMATHPYWSSLRAQDDLYWQRINHLNEGTTKVPAVTLDGLAARLGVSGPYLLKLDVQGAEVQVLRGARNLLANTHVVICEADLDDFQSINQVLVSADFGLFDLTWPHWLADRSLGWFYPVYVHRKLDHLKTHAFWDKRLNSQVIKGQHERRETLVKELEKTLADIRAARSKQ